MATARVPDVTVVTPSYGQREYIEEAIRSVLEQTGVHIEYLVMDGGSTDGTLEILEKYRDRLHFVSEKDRGQADAINKGLRRASGRIVAYLNSDDFYLPGAIAGAVRFLDHHPEFALVYGEGYHTDAQGKFKERYYTEPFDFQRLAELCIICQPTVFFRRVVLSTVGYFNPNLHYCMDYDYWIRVAKRYAIGYMSHYLAASRLHAEGKTLSKRAEAHHEILNTVLYHYGQVPARWIVSYAHIFVQQYFGTRIRVHSKAFNVLVRAIFLLKYVQMNKRLPVHDFMDRLRRSNSEATTETPRP